MLDKKTIRRLLAKDDPIVVEIGAHYGYDTREFLESFPGIRIYCFEPDPRNVAAFKRNINDERCVLEEAAVSSFDGEANLHMSGGRPYPGPWPVVTLVQLLGLGEAYGIVSGLFRGKARQEDWTASSSIKRSVSHSTKYPWLTFDKAVGVKVVKLDTYVKSKGIASIDLVWVDAQGAERDVIEGATEALRMTTFLFTEYGETAPYPEAMSRRETIRVMREHGFELVPDHSSSIRKEVGDLLFRNKAFVAPTPARFAPAEDRLSAVSIRRRLLRLLARARDDRYG